jgi:hypothetical protein
MENLKESSSDVTGASMHPIVTGRLCVCNGLCHRDTLPDGMRCTLDEQLDSLKSFVVVCIDRTRDSDLLVFWKPHRAGYTVDLEQAGSYSSNEAKEICSSGHHVPFLRSELERSKAKRTVIDRDGSPFFSKVSTSR